MARIMMKRFAVLFVALAGLCASPAFAQSTFPTAQGGRVAGTVPMSCDANGANCVQGSIPSGTADAGNGTKIAGVFNTAPAAVADGQRRDIQTSSRGDVFVQIRDGFNQSVAATVLNSDANSAAAVSVNAASYGYHYNGTSWDRQRGDATGQYVVEVPSAAVAAGIVAVASAAVSGGVVVKASPGNLYGYNVVAGAVAGYVMIFNSTTVPADGAVTPLRCIPLAANAGIEVNMRGQPQRYSTGIAIAFSTTGCFTKTASATAFISGDAQ